MSANVEYAVESVENAIEAVHAIGSADRTKAQVAGALIGWLAKSKMVVAEFQTAYISEAVATKCWPVDTCKKGDEGAIEVDGKFVKPYGMNKAMEKANRTEAVSDWMSTRQYLVPLELTDKGALKLKGGKPKLDAAKKSCTGGAAAALAAQGVVEPVVGRTPVGKGKNATETKGGTEAVLKALYAQLKSTTILMTFEEDEDTWGDVLEELAATLEIKL